MALVVCSDCEGKVSEKARACIHCGNPLLEDRPGVIGSALRVLYGLFCIALVVIIVVAVTQPGPLPSERFMIGVIGFGIWFAVSIAIAVLLYVTRAGRVERVTGAVRTA